MILNIPSKNDYQNVGFECLIQAYKNICQIDNEELIEGISRDEIWNYNRIVLKTSIILVHQGVEALLKSKISEKSALLLIEQKKSEWKTLPESEDIDFSDLFTISGNELIRTFYATVEPTVYPNEFVKFYEDLRLLRNKLVHGIGNVLLNPEITLKYILNSFTFLYGKNAFWRALKDKFYDHPGQMEENARFVFGEYEQYIHIEYLEALLGKAELNKHFEVDFKARRYYCPECTGEVGVLVTENGEVSEYPNFKYTFLTPNEPTSTTVKCLICENSFEVERNDCNKEGCKGNVIYTDEEDKDEVTGEIYDEGVKICLTCNEIQ